MDLASQHGGITDLAGLGQSAAALEPRQVGVWTIPSRAIDPVLCRSLLTAEERARLDRMRLGLAREEFLAGRACLRLLLGGALTRPPHEIVIHAGGYGKPWVQGLECNVAHSHGLVLIALSRTAVCGIDLECMDPTIEALDIARGSFSHAEIEAIEQTPAGPARIAAFYRLWTRKEAAVKAHGQGLTLPLAGFTVVPGEPRETVVELAAAEPLSFNRLYLRDLPVPAGFAAALALSAPGIPLVSHRIESAAL